MKRLSSRNSGSLLMLALWALLLISVVVFAWVKAIDYGIDNVSHANRGMEARALAHSGIAVALHPNVTPYSPHLNASFDGNRAYRVTIQSEGARLNLNYLLAGTDPDKLQLLKQYLALKGLTVQEQAVFTDCLLDWVGPGGGLHRPNGAPEGPDYQPPHRPLQSLEEIPLIKGSGPLISNPDWQDDLTIYSSGPLDLESAPAELLALVPGIGEQRAQQFVKTREERELQKKNKDGRPFKDLAEARSFLGLSQDQFAKISRFLGFHDPVLHIQSEGESGKVIRQVDAIVRKVPGANAQTLLWIEK
ncbi:MAG: hypothetical protein WCO68_06720 [Verrucomicrobiota bacterium]